MDVEVNLIAVLVAGLSSMVVGSVWYTPKVFGNSWARLAKVKMDRKVSNREMTVLMGSTLVASIITAYILAHVAYLSNQFFGNAFLQDSLTTAFWLWLGFTAARIYVHDAFESRPLKLTVMNAAHELLTVLVMGLVIGLIGV